MRQTRWGAIPAMGVPQLEAVLACASYSFCSIALTLANKAIFSEASLNFPWCMLLVQSAFVVLLLLAYATSPFVGSKHPVSRTLLRQLCVPCLFFTLFIFTNARALRHVSLPTLTVIKSLAPLCVAITERALFGEPLATGTIVAMALIVAANVVGTTGDADLHAAGYFWAVLNVAVNVAYIITLRACVDNEHSAADKALHANVLAVAFIAPVAVTSGEAVAFVPEFILTSTKFRALFLLSCILAAGIGSSVFWVLRAASGSTLSFVGATNKVLVVILGAILFRTDVSRAGWAGVTVGIAAGGCFAVSKSLNKSKTKGLGSKKRVLLATESQSEQRISFDK